jgi:hypothetical protein
MAKISAATISETIRRLVKSRQPRLFCQRLNELGEQRFSRGFDPKLSVVKRFRSTPRGMSRFLGNDPPFDDNGGPQMVELFADRVRWRVDASGNSRRALPLRREYGK